MEGAYVSAIAALAGSVIGGFTSFATSWLVQQNQTKIAQRTQELNKRELVYGAFMDEVSKRFGEAFEREQGSVADLVTLYAQISRMQLFAPTELVEEARKVMISLVATYRAPPRAFSALQEEHSADPLRQFSVICRNDLKAV